MAIIKIKQQQQQQEEKQQKSDAKGSRRKIWSPTPELSAYHFAFSATSHRVCPVQACVCFSECLCVSVRVSHYRSALNGMQWQQPRGYFEVALSLALRVCPGMFHVILLLFCSISATFGSVYVCVRVCRVFVSHVAGGFSLPVPSRHHARDKVLSYDLLKCPNATITRDYYKCIPRVQRAMSDPEQDATASTQQVQGGAGWVLPREEESARKRAEQAVATNCFGPQLTNEILNHSSAPFAFRAKLLSKIVIDCRTSRSARLGLVIS